MFGPLGMMVDFIKGNQPKPTVLKVESLNKSETPEAEVTKPLSPEDPYIQTRLRDFFSSDSWPYVKDALMKQIVVYQMRVDRELQADLRDPKDTNGRLSSFNGGRLRAGEEIRQIIERLRDIVIKGK